MKKERPNKRDDIKQCIVVGIVTMSDIADYLGYSKSCISSTLKKMVEAGVVEKTLRGKANVYRIARGEAYHDPFGLAKRVKNPNTFILPPRRTHSIEPRA
jgi:predicted transcriptional regulator of viral defense system